MTSAAVLILNQLVIQYNSDMQENTHFCIGDMHRMFCNTGLNTAERAALSDLFSNDTNSSTARRHI